MLEKTIVMYVTPNGRKPFDEWLEGLWDEVAVARINVRLNRVRNGNFGDAKSVGKGVHELRFNFGGGLRIYFGMDGDKLVILLMGGDKRSQVKDIMRAKEYWYDYCARK